MAENKDSRSSNFCKEETGKLMLLLQDYPVITCKKTDHSSNKLKDDAWKLLSNKFNSDATRYRSVKQLQQKYNNMKKTARKEMAQEKYGRRETGGGPAPPKPSETTEWLNSVMKESISGLNAVYDSDALETIDLVKNKINTQDADSSANVNLNFLDDKIFEESVTPHITLPKTNETVVIEKEIFESNFPNNNDADETNVFDTSTPKSMLRKPVSKELGNSMKKRSSAYTPLETRKQIFIHTNKKNELLSCKQARELELLKYAQEEHEQNMRFKKEAHEQASKQQQELHELEKKYKKEMYNLIIEKCKYEVEKAKIELNNVCK